MVLKNVKEKKFLNTITEVIRPLIPIIVIAGLLISISNIFEIILGKNFFEDNKNSFWKSISDLIFIPANVIFQFLPILICWSIFNARKSNNKMLGIVIGIIITCSRELYTIYDEEFKQIFSNKGTISLDFWKKVFTHKKLLFDFQWFHFPLKINATGQILPAFLAGYLGSTLEKKFFKSDDENKLFIHKKIIYFAIIILTTYLLTLFVFIPVNILISYYFKSIILLAFTNNISRWFLGFLLGFCYPFLVMTGFHIFLLLVELENISTIGGTFTFPIVCISNMAQAISSFSYILLNKKNYTNQQQKENLSISSMCFLGVTEPAMYKINIPSFFPFWNALIASGVGSFLSIISGVTSNSVGIGDFLAILLIQKNSKIEGVQTFPGTGFLWFFIANLVTVIIVLIFNFICYYSFNKIKKFKDKHNKVKLRDY